MFVMWLRTTDPTTEEYPFTIHTSFGDKWYIKKVLHQPNVYVVAEFFGILDEDFNKAEEMLRHHGGEVAKFKTWKFKRWEHVRYAVTDIYLTVDRAYYDYETIKDFRAQVVKDIVCVKDFVIAGTDMIRGIKPEDEYDEFEFSRGDEDDDEVIGDINQYIAESNPEREAEFHDDVEVDSRFKFNTVKYVPRDIETLFEHPWQIDNEENYETSHDTLVDELNAKPVLIPRTRNITERSRCTESVSLSPRIRVSSTRSLAPTEVTVASAGSEFDDPLVNRGRRRRVLRAILVNEVLARYYSDKEQDYDAIYDMSLTQMQRDKALRHFNKTYTDVNLLKLMRKIKRIFLNEPINDTQQLQRQVPVRMNIVELQNYLDILKSNAAAARANGGQVALDKADREQAKAEEKAMQRELDELIALDLDEWQLSVMSNDELKSLLREARSAREDEAAEDRREAEISYQELIDAGLTDSDIARLQQELDTMSEAEIDALLMGD